MCMVDCHKIGNLKGIQSMKKPSSITIVGGGVVGVATAYAFARRGVKVTIIDKHDQPAMGTSKANGAQLSYAYTDALASPRILTSIPRLSFGLDPAFRFHWRWNSAYLQWMMCFLRNCTDSRFRSNTLAVLALAQKSRSAMEALFSTQPIEFGHRIAGKMHLYENPQAFSRAIEIMNMKGLSPDDQQALTIDQAIEIEPSLANVQSRIAGVLYTPEEAVGDSRTFTRELLNIMESQYDVTRVMGSSVETINFTGDRAIVETADDRTIISDLAILCTGSNASSLLKGHNIRLPISAMKGYSFSAPAGSSAPDTSITDTDRRLVFTKLGNRIRIAGLADLGDDSLLIKEERMATLIASARTSLPDAANYDATTDHWAGLRPMTPNSMPIIKTLRPGLAVNVGHGMLGWTLAMGSGEQMVETICGT